MKLADANGPLSASGGLTVEPLVSPTPSTTTPEPTSTVSGQPSGLEATTEATPIYDGVLPVQGTNWGWVWWALIIVLVLGVIWILVKSRRP